MCLCSTQTPRKLTGLRLAELIQFCANSGPEHAQQTWGLKVLFDYLVGEGEQRRRDGYAERLGSSQVDD